MVSLEFPRARQVQVRGRLPKAPNSRIGIKMSTPAQLSGSHGRKFKSGFEIVTV
jgi:hypothetical protein